MGTRFGKCFTLMTLTALLPGAVLLFAAAATAQEAESVERSYGRGVHAYFRGDVQTAHEELTRGIDAGTQDPRCYYFRALVYLRTGRGELASSDMATGARLESLDTEGAYPVDQSLQRVQGRARMMLQNHRHSARNAVDQQAKQRRLARYESMLATQATIVRKPVRVPLESLSDDGAAPQVEVVTSPTPAIEEAKPEEAKLPEAGSILEDNKADALAGNPFGDDEQVAFEKPTVAKEEAAPAFGGGAAFGGAGAVAGQPANLTPEQMEAMQGAAGLLQGLQGLIGGMAPGPPGGGFPGEAGGFPGEEGGFPGEAGGFPAAKGGEEFGFGAPPQEAMKAPDAAKANALAEGAFGEVDVPQNKNVAPDQAEPPVAKKIQSNGFSSNASSAGFQLKSAPAQNPFGQPSEEKETPKPKANSAKKLSSGFSMGSSVSGASVSGAKIGQPKAPARTPEEPTEQPEEEAEKKGEDDSETLFDE